MMETIKKHYPELLICLGYIGITVCAYADWLGSTFY